MKNTPLFQPYSALSPRRRIARFFGFVPVCVSLLVLHSSLAGSATWLENPGEGNLWESTIDWTPETVPNSPTDTATFGFSNVTNPFLEFIRLDGIVYEPAASAYTTIVAGVNPNLSFYGAGITNNSGTLQSFTLNSSTHGSASVDFFNSSTAGSVTSFLVNGGSFNTLGARSFAIFHNDSSAGGSSWTVTGGSAKIYRGGTLTFLDNATADQATITVGGATSHAAKGAVATFAASSAAGTATLIATAGTAGGGGSTIFMNDTSTGDEARVEVFGNSGLQVGGHAAPGLKIGSLEGDGLVFIGANNLTIGTNGLDTTFSGVIHGTTGGITKMSLGRLTLANANTYSGATTIVGGGLIAANATGSATGTGAVTVKGGRLGGGGTIAGAVTVGTGLGSPASLAPGDQSRAPATLTVQGNLTFNSDGIYTYTAKANRGGISVEQVAAGGVTIAAGAQFEFFSSLNDTLAVGTTLNVITNTAATPISGVFANLADGATVTAGANTLQASYEGGDGNDLTLTVIP